MRVVVTRERGHNAELISWLPDGVTVSEVPLTTTRYFDSSEVHNALSESAHFGQFRALVVTSARSALYVALAREALAPGARVLTVGTATARALEERGCGCGRGRRHGCGGPRRRDQRRTGFIARRGRHARRIARGARSARGRGRKRSPATRPFQPISPRADEDRTARSRRRLRWSPVRVARSRAYLDRTRTWVVVPGPTTAADVVALASTRVAWAGSAEGPHLREASGRRL